MIGLLRKDYYLIIKNIQPIILIALFPPALVAAQNTAFLMPILSIVIPLIFASQLSTTMELDETTKWRKNVTAMPISHLAEAGSKYVLLICLSLISIVLLLAGGLIAFAFGLITFQKIVLYCVLGLFYSLFYGFITIPTSYRYGTANSKYFFMLFIFIPTLVPVVLSTLNIKIDLTILERMNSIILALIIISIFLVAGIISFYICLKVLDRKA